MEYLIAVIQAIKKQEDTKLIYYLKPILTKIFRLKT